MRALIARAGKRILRGYDFVCTVVYYLRRGYSLGFAIELARSTL